MTRGWMAIALIASFGCGSPIGPGELYYGDKPVSYWLKAIESTDAKIRKKAADVLGNVGPSDPAAIPALIRALKDRDPRVRDAAVLALSKLGRAAEPAADSLDSLTSDRDPLVRQHAAMAAARVRGRN